MNTGMTVGVQVQVQVAVQHYGYSVDDRCCDASEQVIENRIC